MSNEKHFAIRIFEINGFSNTEIRNSEILFLVGLELNFRKVAPNKNVRPLKSAETSKLVLESLRIFFKVNSEEEPRRHHNAKIK